MTVNELIILVNIALGDGEKTISNCASGDENGDGQVTVNEILKAVNAALSGCAPPTAVPSSTPTRTATVTPTAVPSSTPTPTATATPTAVPSRPPQRSGADAVKASSRVALATVGSIEIIDFGLIGTGRPVRASAAAARRARPAVETRLAFLVERQRRLAVASGDTSTPCSGAGTMDASCQQDGHGTTFTTTFAHCASAPDLNGEIITTDGVIMKTAADPMICTGEVADNVSVTMRFSNFTQSVADTNGNVQQTSIPEFSDSFTPTGARCDGKRRNGTELISGTLDFRCDRGCPPSLRNVALTANNLAVERQSGGSPCSDGTMVRTGSLEVNNHGTGEGFAQQFSDFLVAAVEQPDSSAKFTLKGRTTVDCLGKVRFDTPMGNEIQLGTDAKCPSNGELDVTLGPDVLMPGDVLSAATSPRGDEAAQQTTGAGAPTAVGLRDTALRAANGQVYQVLQNAGGNPEFGIEDFRITTVVGSTIDVARCDIQSTGGNASLVAAVAAQNPQSPDAVFKSLRIADATQPCFNPKANEGNGAVCIGPDCDVSCGCALHAACSTFTIGDGTALSTETDIPAASMVDALATVSASCASLVKGRATYRFGGSGPTTEVPLCSPEPEDGFLLPKGTTVILAYDVPFGSPFVVGSAGFPVDRDGANPFGCGKNRILSPEQTNRTLKLPPRVSFNATGVRFDFNADALTDEAVPTCEDPTLFQCVPAPLATPTPNPACEPLDIGSRTTIQRSGSTVGARNLFGGASCGGGGNDAPDFAFTYKALVSGFYTIDTMGSDFDTVLYVRNKDCTGPEVACNDDHDLNTVQSQIGLILQAGQRIVIVVDGFGTQSGNFILNVKFASAPPTPTPTPLPVFALPDLVVTELTGPSTGVIGGQITVSATVANQGNGDTGAFQAEFLYSVDAVLDDNDALAGFGCVFSHLPAGGSAVCRGPIDVPDSLAPGGTYRLGAIVDRLGQVAESDESNNARVAGTGPIVIVDTTPGPSRTPTMTPAASRTPSPTFTAARTPSPTLTASPTPTALTITLLISNDPNLTNPGSITTDGVNLYVGEDGVGDPIGNKVVSVPIGGGAATVLYSSATPCCFAGLTRIGTDLFWIDQNGDPDATAIFSAPTSGGAITKIYSGFATGQPIVDGDDITTDGLKLYTTDQVQGRVHSLNPDGSDITQLGSRYGGFFDLEHGNTIAEDGDVLYIADNGTRAVLPQVVAIATNGGAFTTLAVGAPFVLLQGIAVGNGKVFVADPGASNTIWELPTTGGVPTALVSVVSGAPFVSIERLLFFNNALYVTDNGNVGTTNGPGAIYKIAFPTLRGMVARRHEQRRRGHR